MVNLANCVTKRMIRVEIASMCPNSVARFPKCLQTFGHHWLLRIVVDKRNHVHVTKVCKESCNTGAKGYWHFYSMEPTPVWLLKHYLESRVWTWNCECKMIDVVKVQIFFIVLNWGWELGLLNTHVNCMMRCSLSHWSTMSSSTIHSQNNCSIFQDFSCTPIL